MIKNNLFLSIETHKETMQKDTDGKKIVPDCYADVVASAPATSLFFSVHTHISTVNSPFLQCLNAQYVISATRGLYIKTMKTLDVVPWSSEVVWDQGIFYFIS